MPVERLIPARTGRAIEEMTAGLPMPLSASADLSLCFMAYVP